MTKTGRRWLLGIGAAYLLALHAALVLSFDRQDLNPLLRRAGLRPIPAPEFDRFHASMRAMLRRVDSVAGPGRVVFLGASTLHGLDAAAVAPDALNLAIGGDTTLRLLTRLGDYRSLPTASAVVLLVGLNDLTYRTPEEAGELFGRILERLPPVPLVAGAVLPVDEAAAWPRNADIRRLNAAIRAHCARRPDCVFVDPGPQLADAAGNLAPRFRQHDGIHLTAEGYRVLIGALREGLASARGRPS
ncbi:GDSL-type esterase/lipase family protein [Arenibaculum pallidiluteum]|uniref:GDSL-type esterase/lipase family protein n=1 Tax=Arenibaculum pallidiluteum TaxID=2812559 RepID=UPI001A97BA5D|nr:GDSL-type esterase/lipase family protein [Arenibaculum pallidiluteum]